MSSLYKRATPIQKKMLRIVEGAVRNALDAHPSILLTGDMSVEIFARSVAKRAIGTLSSQMEVLAGSNLLPATGGGVKSVDCPAVVG